MPAVYSLFHTITAVLIRNWSPHVTPVICGDSGCRLYRFFHLVQQPSLGSEMTPRPCLKLIKYIYLQLVCTYLVRNISKICLRACVLELTPYTDQSKRVLTTCSQNIPG